MRADQQIATESLIENVKFEKYTSSRTASTNTKSTYQVRLVFACQAPETRTYIHEQYVTYPFHICRAYYSPKDPPVMASLYLQSTSGGIFEGDRTNVSIILKENTKAHIRTAAATVVHRMEKDFARQEVFIEAGPGSFCEYLPHPLILFPKANLISRIDLTVDPTATVIFCDSFITHNPNNSEEIFTCLSSDLCVRNPAGEVLVRDRSSLTGNTYKGETPGVTGRYKAQATLMVINHHINHESLVSVLRTGLADLNEVYWGVSTLPSNAGAWVRMLAIDGASLREGLDLAWKIVREFMVGSATLSVLK